MSEAQLLSFFPKYSRHQLTKPAQYTFDEEYFWTVLAPYAGTIDVPIFVYIDGENIKCDFLIAELLVTNDAMNSNGNPTRYRLINTLIHIFGDIHSNLIYIDTFTKEVIRFEPINFGSTLNSNYININIDSSINKYLSEAFNNIYPDYTYRMLSEHPQKPSFDSHIIKGMSAAYVLNKAMRLITGYDRPLNGNISMEESKILRFIDAIEIEYGNISDDESSDDSDGDSEDMETGEYGKTPKFKTSKPKTPKTKAVKPPKIKAIKSSPSRRVSSKRPAGKTLKQQNAEAASTKGAVQAKLHANRAATAAKVSHINELLKTKSVAEVNQHLNAKPSPPPIPERPSGSHMSNRPMSPALPPRPTATRVSTQTSNGGVRSDGLVSSGSHTTTTTTRGTVSNVSSGGVSGRVKQ